LFGCPEDQHLEIPPPPQLLFPIQTCPLDAPPTSQKQKTLSLFPFSKFFLFLFNFLFLKNANFAKSNMLWKRRKMKNWWIFREREKIKMQMRKKGEKSDMS
jgi:hypothetical protein